MAGGPKNKEIQSNTKEKISSQQKFNSKQTVEHFFPTRPPPANHKKTNTKTNKPQQKTERKNPARRTPVLAFQTA